MRSPKHAKVCSRCHEIRPSRYRAQVDAHICAECWAQPAAVTQTLQVGPRMAVQEEESGWEIQAEHLR